MRLFERDFICKHEKLCKIAGVPTPRVTQLMERSIATHLGYVSDNSSIVVDLSDRALSLQEAFRPTHEPGQHSIVFVGQTCLVYDNGSYPQGGYY